MEVNAGYKQTEVGIIPEDWKTCILSECAKRIKDGEHWTPKRSDSGYYLLSARNVLNGRIDLSDVDYVEEDEYKRIRQRCNPDVGDVLISCSGTVGRVATVPEGLQCVMVRSVAFVKPDPSNLKGIFLQYFLQSAEGQKQISIKINQGAQPNLFINHIEDLYIPLPPTIAEQVAIAEALSDADALIEALEGLIAKKRQVKQGAMQELLTPPSAAGQAGKRRLPGFIGEWNEKKLGDIAEITKLAGFEYSKYFNSYKDGGDIIVIRGTNITHNRLDLSDIKTIPQSTSNFLHRSKLQKGDLVFAYVGTIGPVYLITENNKYHLGPNTARITVKSDNSPIFVFWYFCSSLAKKEIDERISVGAQPSLSMTKIRNFKISLPTHSEQTAIAETLSDMDAEIAALEGKLSKARQVKQGMMSELLTGRVRLV